MPLPRIETRLPVRQRSSTHDTHYTNYKAITNRVCRYGRASMRKSLRLTQKKSSVTNVLSSMTIKSRVLLCAREKQ
jgi:hypothetical protein